MKKLTKVWKVFITVLAVIAVLAFISMAIIYIFFGDKIEKAIGKNVDEIFYSVSTGVITVAGGYALTFKKLGTAVSTLTGTNNKASEEFKSASKMFTEVGKELTELRESAIENKAEFAEIKRQMAEEREELKALATSIKSLVKRDALLVTDGTAIEVCKTINEKFEVKSNENESNNSAT